MKTVIVSDLHLGALNSRTDLLAGMLASDFDRLVINGDTVDSPDPGLFSRQAWMIIERLRKIARERDLVVIRGNHDVLPGPDNPRGERAFLQSLLGVEVVDEYELEIGGENYLITHGDQFDRTMNLTWVGDVADRVYRRIQRASRRFAHVLKAASKRVCGVHGAVQRGAVQYAEQRGYAGIITGHTHYCQDEWVGGLHYLNTGCWVDHPCSYVQVQFGTARLQHWEENSKAVVAAWADSAVAVQVR